MTKPAQDAVRPIGRLFKIAVSAGIESAVKLHISRGDNLECRDEKGLTPLMIAASRNRAGVCRLLIAAGADVFATDHAGRNALAIAREFGASSALEIIAATLDRLASKENLAAKGSTTVDDIDPSAIALRNLTTGHDPEPHANAEGVATGSSPEQKHHKYTDNTENSAAEHFEDTSLQSNVVLDEQSKALNLRAEDHQPAIELTFGDWEAVVMTEPPQEDMKVVTAEAERQLHIDSHMPIDHSAGWDDFEAFLPELASPPPRVGDHEFRQSLRKLLLRALREGSVPRLAIEDALFMREDGEDHSHRVQATLELILDDLGSDIDERLEFSSEIPCDNFEVFVDPVETAAEEAEVDGAILHFEELLSDGNDPLRMYYRAIAKHSLLTAEQEIELGRKMEEAAANALDALAIWPLGLKHFFSEISKANTGVSSLSSIVVLASSNAEEADSNADSDESFDIESHFDIDQGDDGALTSIEGTTPVIDDVLEVFSNIRALVTESPRREVAEEIRSELGRIRFRRPFLIGLDKVALVDRHPSASAYRSSIAQLVHCRNQMAQANVRLVMDLARRRRHSGLSLEDLIQEGNLGLLKAIDRFDWRRGFRFSTMATWWIKQQLGRGICDTALTIRLPVHVHEKVSRSSWEIERQERMHGKSASLAEKAAICNMPLDKYELVARALSDPLSIVDAKQEGWFKSEDVDEPFTSLAASEEARLVDNLLAKLKPNEAEVLRLRFGIQVNEHKTLEQVGEIFGVTRERIRQIEAKAMRKLLSAPYYDPIAKALGRAPLRHQTAPAEEDISIGDDTTRTNTTSAHSSLSETQESSDVSCPVAVTSAPISNSVLNTVPKSLQRLIDLAHQLGVSVTRDPSGSGTDFVFGEIKQQNIKARKLVRDLIGMGYTWQPGKGYRQ
ncbi:sigma-70 family RNA polymerase sigma factor [Burkholderia cepacia]|uniref:sigma-70 family RNA polymerase sigma factor n=1 Tax=Burkholderia cepacia TaxID=292 RepID=UPI0009BD6D0A|nr:sigma-70 family RNA polymerase sigma factor [Burkholderia cepacia]